MRIRRIGVGAVVTALALGGIVVGAGPASAAKPVLSGTLSCVTTGSTAIKPGIVFDASFLPKGKDKAPKYTTTGGGNTCTGAATGKPLPASYTLSSKAKGVSRKLVGAPCGGPNRSSKTKITFVTGDKIKANLVSATDNYAFNPNTQVITQFPPCGSSGAVANAFAVAHGNDRIATYSSGTSGGKAYPGKVIRTRSVTQETLIQELGASLSANGVTLLHGDPAFSVLTIGMAGPLPGQ